MRIIITFFICLVGLNACSYDYAEKLPVQPIDITRDNFKIGKNDVLMVLVFGEDDLSGNYRVTLDGTIEMPLIGSINIGNLSYSAAADKIEIAYKMQNYLIDPKVTLRDVWFNGFKGLNKDCFEKCS